MKFKNTLTALFFMFNVYAFGGGVMQGMMNYPAWKLIGTAEFPAFHQAVATPIFMFFVPIFFSSVPISILMIWFGHRAISRKLLVAFAIINLIIFGTTIAFAIPIQTHLEAGKTDQLIDKLIFYDHYLRIFPGFLGMILNFVMLNQILRKATP